MSSSDQSDDGTYVSDEEITSFMHLRNSSSDEALNVKGEDMIYSRRYQMFEYEKDFPLDQATSTIKLRLSDLMKQNEAAVYLSPSFMRDWTISQDVPPEVICDACVFSDTQTVCLITFHQGGEADEILRYNAKITRNFVSKVRKVSNSNFTALSGVFDEADCNTEESFMMKMHKLESEARKKFVPNWLHMDGARRSQIVEIFLKMGQKCGKQWLDVSDSLNELGEKVTLTTKRKYHSDTKTLENGFAGHNADSTAIDMEPPTSLEYSNRRESSYKRIKMSSNREIEELETRSLNEVYRRIDLETSIKLCPMSPMTPG